LLGRLTRPLADHLPRKVKAAIPTRARPLRPTNKPVPLAGGAQRVHPLTRPPPGTTLACAPEVAGLSQSHGGFLALQQRSFDVRSEPR
jgi:hypothetical protein